MSLNIKNEGTHALVRQLATLMGVTQTQAVENAVKRQLAELAAEHDGEAVRYARIMAIGAEMRQILDGCEEALSTDALYDAKGLPR
jgi:antitoxin VapB